MKIEKVCPAMFLRIFLQDMYCFLREIWVEGGGGGVELRQTGVRKIGTQRAFLLQTSEKQDLLRSTH